MLKSAWEELKRQNWYVFAAIISEHEFFSPLLWKGMVSIFSGFGKKIN